MFRGAAPRSTVVGWAIASGAAAALVAIGVRAVWRGLPGGPLATTAVLAFVAAGALMALRYLVRATGGPRSTRNLLARQLAVAAREAEVTRLQRFAADAPIGIVLVSRDGQVRFANDEYLRIVRGTGQQVESERRAGDAWGLIEWLKTDQRSRQERELVKDDGTRVPVLVAISRQSEGFAAFLVDLSAEKAALRARDETEARLRAAAAALEEAHRRKDEFLAMLSHELRNPLAPIRNAVFLLRRGALQEPELRERTLGAIERQVEHLTRLVDDLLDVTRITRGKVELRRERVQLSDLLRRTIEDHRPLADAAGVTLEVEAPDGPVFVDGDPTRLMQVVGNLVQNAIKFSSRGGSVSVSLLVRRPGETAEVRVRDEGAGIEPELLEHVFEPFVQGERTLERSRGGLGLGLALVKALAEMHDGTVAATSRGKGQGAEFTVTLPLARRELPHVRVTAPHAPRGTRASRVLVVEDNQDVAESLRDLVESFGHEVHVARSGDLALAHARKTPPDVVLCDIGLPGMTGYDVAREFRKDPALRHARLVAVSGYTQPQDRRDAAEAGFDRHVAKPPDPGELEKLLG